MKDEVRAFVLNDLLSGKLVADDENLLLSGLVDSLGVMRLVAHLEKRHQVTIPPEDVVIEHFESIDAIAAYMTRSAA